MQDQNDNQVPQDAPVLQEVPQEQPQVEEQAPLQEEAPVTQPVAEGADAPVAEVPAEDDPADIDMRQYMQPQAQQVTPDADGYIDPEAYRQSILAEVKQTIAFEKSEEKAWASVENKYSEIYTLSLHDALPISKQTRNYETSQKLNVQLMQLEAEQETLARLLKKLSVR